MKLSAISEANTAVRKKDSFAKQRRKSAANEATHATKETQHRKTKQLKVWERKREEREKKLFLTSQILEMEDGECLFCINCFQALKQNSENERNAKLPRLLV